MQIVMRLPSYKFVQGAGLYGICLVCGNNWAQLDVHHTFVVIIFGPIFALLMTLVPFGPNNARQPLPSNAQNHYFQQVVSASIYLVFLGIWLYLSQGHRHAGAYIWLIVGSVVIWLNYVFLTRYPETA